MTYVWILVGLVVGGSAAFPLGWWVRARIPMRIPTNQTRIEDAQTDVKLAELTMERRRVSYQEEAMHIRAEAVIDGLRDQVKELAPITLNGDADGMDDLLLMVATARREKELTQRDLASRSRIPERRLRLVLSGESPTIKEIHQLADALDLTVRDVELSRPSREIVVPEMPQLTSVSEEISE